MASVGRRAVGVGICLILLAGCGSRGTLLDPTQLPSQTANPTPGAPVGQPSGGPIGQPSGGPVILPTPVPGQPAGGVPAWIAPGVRLTWYVAAASVAQSRYSFVEEACTPSSWRTPDGKCYRRTDESGEGQGGGSGDGYSQLDIVGFDGGRVSLNSDLYGIDYISGVFVWTPIGGGTVDAQRLEGAWANPAELAQAANQGFGDLLVLRGPFQFGDNTFDSVALVSGLGTSTYQSYVYDIATGILLSAQSSTAGAVSPVRAVGEDPPVGNTQLTMARFMGMRARTLPGAGAANPDWLAQTNELSYAGLYNWTNPIDPGSGNLNFDITHTVGFEPGGSHWAPFTARTQVPGLAIDSSVRGVAGATGMYWYSPAALATMSSGQVLDTDPVTGERTTVAFVGQGASGGQVVTLETSMPGVTNRFTYQSASGMLVAYESRQAATGISAALQLVSSR